MEAEPSQPPPPPQTGMGMRGRMAFMAILTSSSVDLVGSMLTRASLMACSILGRRMGGLGLGIDGISGYYLHHLPPFILYELLSLLGSQAYLALFDDGLGDGEGIGGAEGLLQVFFRTAVTPRGIFKDILHSQDLFQIDALSSLFKARAPSGSTSTSNVVPWV